MKQGRRPLLQGLAQAAANRTYGPARQILNLNRAPAIVPPTQVRPAVAQPAPAPTPPAVSLFLRVQDADSGDAGVVKFDGTAWSIVSYPDSFSSGSLTPTFFRKIGTYYWMIAIGADYVLYRSADCVTWTAQLTAASGELIGVAGTSDLYCMERTGADHLIAYKSTDDGGSWSTESDTDYTGVGSPDCFDAQGANIVAYGPGILDVFHRPDHIWVSSDGGASFSDSDLDTNPVNQDALGSVGYDRVRMLDNGRTLLLALFTDTDTSDQFYRVSYADSPGGPYTEVELERSGSGDEPMAFARRVDVEYALMLKNADGSGQNLAGLSADGAAWVLDGVTPMPYSSSQMNGVHVDASGVWVTNGQGGSPVVVARSIIGGSWRNKTQNLLTLTGAPNLRAASTMMIVAGI